MNTEQTSAVSEQKTLSPEPSTQAASARGQTVALWVLFALFAQGLVSLVYGLNVDSARPDFGLFVVSFLFLMGISQAGVVFCAITRLVRAQWAKPFYRLAELSTLAFFPFAILGFLLIVMYARDDLFYWLATSTDEHRSPWLNINWLLARDMFCLLLFYGLSAFYVFKGLGPDLANDSTALSVNQSNVNHREVERQLYTLSPLVIICFIICNTFFAWDFAMMLIPHWHSTVFPIIFWFGNLFAGSAALIVLPALLGCSSSKHAKGFSSDPANGSYFGYEQIHGLGMLITAFTLLWLYFFWAQFFVIWFGNLPHETVPLWRQMYGHYAPYYWAMMAGCFFVPFAALIFAIVKRSLAAMCMIGFGINLGIWINKYLMVVPVFSADDTPFDSWLDISLSLGLLAGFLMVVVMLARRLPIYAYWEINLKPIDRH